jgi:hypothetical protein
MGMLQLTALLVVQLPTEDFHAEFGEGLAGTVGGNAFVFARIGQADVPQLETMLGMVADL